MDLKNLWKQASSMEDSDDDPRMALYVVPRHTKWLEKLEEEQIFSEEAIKFANGILRRQFKYERSGRYSPSSLGECQRRVILGFNGAPKDAVNLDSLDLMEAGTRDHFWWQLEGLTMGWMVEAEAWRHKPEYRLGGSLDGIMADDSIFELKTVHSAKYSRIIRENTPLPSHILQIHAYMLLSGLGYASLVYQSRDNGDFTEYRIKRDPTMMLKLHAQLDKLDRFVDADELPEILDDCEMRQGTQYRQCDWRTECLRLHGEGR